MGSWALLTGALFGLQEHDLKNPKILEIDNHPYHDQGLGPARWKNQLPTVNTKHCSSQKRINVGKDLRQKRNRRKCSKPGYSHLVFDKNRIERSILAVKRIYKWMTAKYPWIWLKSLGIRLYYKNVVALNTLALKCSGMFEFMIPNITRATRS